MATRCGHVLHANCLVKWLTVFGDEGRVEYPVCSLTYFPSASEDTHALRILERKNLELMEQTQYSKSWQRRAEGFHSGNRTQIIPGKKTGSSIERANIRHAKTVTGLIEAKKRIERLERELQDTQVQLNKSQKRVEHLEAQMRPIELHRTAERPINLFLT